jgi:hypothetical protein
MKEVFLQTLASIPAELVPQVREWIKVARHNAERWNAEDDSTLLKNAIDANEIVLAFWPGNFFEGHNLAVLKGIHLLKGGTTGHGVLPIYVAREQDLDSLLPLIE